MNQTRKSQAAQTVVTNHVAIARVSFAQLVMLVLIGLAGLSIGCNATTQRQNMLGKAAFDRGDNSSAINAFQQALNRDPKNADAYYNLAACYYKLGVEKQNKQFVDQAEQLYRQAISYDDKHIDAHRGLSAMLIETGREKYAFDLLDGWRQRYPQSAEPLVEIARLYQEYGDNRRATDLLADALRNDSRNARALKAMGYVREVQGENQLALENYMRALQVNGSDQDTANRVAYLQSRIASAAGQSGSATSPARYGAAAPYLTR
ncbi:tetratricopeptide repeat protein [bacterium]|nr:tetratricopeptide repeat protein [bacterium]